MPNLKYHQKTLELIGQQPEFSAVTYRDLPTSVAEWYSLTNAVELLKQYSNADFPLLVSEFKIYTYRDKALSVFMYDNAGILWYAFDNCGDDDPPVYVNVDPPPDNWVKDSEFFSIFIYTRFFDHLHHTRKGLFIIKNGKPLHKDTLDMLLEKFVSEPVSHFGEGTIVYRFSFKDQRIKIINHEGISSQWLFTADSQASLNKVYEQFEHVL